MSETLQDLHIFEMANNHQGSVDHGLAIVDAMAAIARRLQVRAGVKLQFRDLDSFIHPAAKGRTDIKHVPRFEQTRLAVDQFRQLVKVTRDNGLVTIATPFDEASVDTCLELGIEIIKVASCSARDWPLLERIACCRRPVVASTGGLSLYDVDNLVEFFRKRVPSFAIMHCVAVYPTPPELLSLDYIRKLIRRYPGVKVGYSGHEHPDNTEVVTAAVSQGAQLLERHVGFPTDEIQLNKYSMSPEQAEAWLEAAQRARMMCGAAGTRATTEDEVSSLRSLERGVFAKRQIKSGEEIGKSDVYFAMPRQEGQLTSGEFGRYRATYTASREYATDEPLFERFEQGLMSEIRGILHDAKGQMFEANIQLGTEFTVELSHHAGLESFRRTGCILINLINREYCKKILIMLPGQSHPMHYHKQKEETFHVLWGDIDVHLEKRTVNLNAGDQLLIEREVLHGFSSTNGGIFEEVSTTAYVGDSYYADPQIDQLDPMQRKTVIEHW